MAPSETAHEISERKKNDKSVKSICVHCKRSCETPLQCIKCQEGFHPSCLKQAASKKSAICVHQAAIVPSTKDENEAHKNPKDIEIIYLKRLVQELEEKNKILKENNMLWRERVECLEEKQNQFLKKKGKQTRSSLQCRSVRHFSMPTEDVAITDQSDRLNQKAKRSKCRNNLDNNKVPPTPTDGPTKVIQGQRLSRTSVAQSSPQKMDCFYSTNVTLTDEVFVDVDINKNKEQSDEKWKSVDRRRKKQKLDVSLRPSPIMGTKEDATDLQGVNARYYSWLFLSGLVTSTTPTQIKNYLKTNGITECTCEKLTTRRDDRYSSFKLGVPTASKTVALDPNLWPKGVNVNMFLNLKTIMSQKRPALERQQAQQ